MSRKAPKPNPEASVCKYVAKYGLAAHLFYNSDGSVVAVKLSKPGLDTGQHIDDETSEAAMKPPRSALPLPRYVERKPLKSGGWGYFFHVPSWAKKAGCTVQSRPLGTDYNAAVSRAETILLPAFDAWRTGGDTAAQASSSATIAIGSLDWLFAEYRADRRFAKLDPKSKGQS
jgi:hypothetical protein